MRMNADRLPQRRSPSSSVHQLETPDTPTMKNVTRIAQRGKIGWVVLWLIGIPVPVLLIMFLVRGCT